VGRGPKAGLGRPTPRSSSLSAKLCAGLLPFRPLTEGLLPPSRCCCEVGSRCAEAKLSRELAKASRVGACCVFQLLSLMLLGTLSSGTAVGYLAVLLLSQLENGDLRRPGSNDDSPAARRSGLGSVPRPPAQGRHSNLQRFVHGRAPAARHSGAQSTFCGLPCCVLCGPPPRSEAVRPRTWSSVLASCPQPLWR
jgi:hypothetical protein